MGSSNWAANKDMMWKDTMSKIWTNRVTIISLSRKHCGKRRNCSSRAISPFPTMFSILLENFLPFSSNSKLSPANSSSLSFPTSIHCSYVMVHRLYRLPMYTEPQKKRRNFNNSLRYWKQSIYFFFLKYKFLLQHKVLYSSQKVKQQWITTAPAFYHYTYRQFHCMNVRSIENCVFLCVSFAVQYIRKLNHCQTPKVG